MRRVKRLNKLKDKLIILKEKAAELTKSRVLDDGSIDYDACTKLNHTLTDISLTKRKIGFSEHGKSYLGDALGEKTPRASEFD